MGVLEDTVQAMTAPKKGLLAADESNTTMGKRLEAVGIENEEESRRKYREMLLTTDGVEDFISGVILFEETLYQKTADAKPFVQVLNEKRIVPGIKLDTGVRPIGGKNQEGTTQGLNDLSERAAQFYSDGARFAKWRATYEVDPVNGKPSHLAVELNAVSLARYAAICQENNLVPIVEPEVLMDGSFTMKEYAEATTRVLQRLYHWLNEFGVELKHTVLKPNMIVPSSGGKEEWDLEKIGKMTLSVLKKCVPVEVPAILFLSGGQSEEQAKQSLKAINDAAHGDANAPWILSFSYGRALQTSALKAWGGKDKNESECKQAYFGRAQALSAVVQPKA